MIIGDQTFSSMVNKFAQRVPQLANQVIRKSSLELFTDVVMDTPVDTGRARGNWQISFGSPASGVISEQGDKEGDSASSSPTVQKITDALNSDRTTLTIFLTNNLPYIKKLEYGWSKKAARGMVRKNLMKANIQLLKNIRETAAGGK